MSSIRGENKGAYSLRAIELDSRQRSPVGPFHVSPRPSPIVLIQTLDWLYSWSGPFRVQEAVGRGGADSTLRGGGHCEAPPRPSPKACSEGVPPGKEDRPELGYEQRGRRRVSKGC